MAIIQIRKQVSLDAPIQVDNISGVAFTGEIGAHQFVIACTRGGEAVALTGSVVGQFIRANGTTIAIRGEESTAIDENGCAVVTLPKDCYNVAGRFQLSVFVVDDESENEDAQTVCVYSCVGTVQKSQTGNIVDDGGIINSVAGLVAEIERVSATIPSDYSELSNNAVRVTPQTLTLDKAAQARENIGAADIDLPGTITNRGDLISLGYTSPNNVTTPGIYTFTSANAASLSDMPSGWFGGGVLIVYKGGNVIWQSLRSAQFNFFRYGTVASWRSGFTSTAGARENGRTALGSSVAPGTYMFTTGESSGLTDLPKKWPAGGGMLKTYFGNGTTYQELNSLGASFIRYGTSAQWREHNPSLWVQYHPASDAGSEATDNSLTEFFDVHIPLKNTDGTFIVWRVGHSVNNSINCNTWRIVSVHRENNDNTLTRLSERGEWECALHLAGRSDFSGGVLHGDEATTALRAFADSAPVTINSNLKMRCSTFRFVRVTNLYDPADSSTIIAEHGVEYVFTADGLTVRQSIQWKVNAELSPCYLAMLPMSKSHFSGYYTDVDFTPTSFPTTQSYELDLVDAHMIAEYGSAAVATMERKIYPTGLTGEKALIGDNNTASYHKGYFMVCNGGNVTSGTVWRSCVKYRMA